jgi:predicted transcriptional regulator
MRAATATQIETSSFIASPPSAAAMAIRRHVKHDQMVMLEAGRTVGAL